MNIEPSTAPSSVAAKLMAIEVVSELLASTTAGQLPQTLTSQIREFTGARTVLLIVHPEFGDKHEVLHGSPTRRASLFTLDELEQFCPDVSGGELPWFPDQLPAGHPLRPALKRARIESMLLFPLRAEAQLVGALLLLDLPEVSRLQDVAKSIAPLQPTIAMALKNAISHQRIEKQAKQLELLTTDLERRVAERTADLEAANKSLAASRLDAVRTMEEAVLMRRKAEETAKLLQQEVIERRQVEEELREYREHLEELVENRTGELVMARDRAQAAEAQAEAANRAKSVFLASMSHELRTPLNAILGFSQLMQGDASLNDNQHKNLDVINRSGAHLLGLINDVLDMSRIESGRVTWEVTCFDLWDSLESIKEMLRVRSSAKGVAFILDRDPSLPRYIRADERKLQQVIINLAGNAVKFTQQGEVVLRASGEKEGAVLRFEVKDTGPGMDAATVAGLFEPFMQAHHNREGAGLGLFISQKLVQLMGGKIVASSEPGKGATFAFAIACQSAAMSDVARKSVHRRVIGLAPGQTPPRILVAEDVEESRCMMTATLEAVGFEVLVAENGLEAVKRCEEGAADLVLMDMRMPVMDGFEAIEQIRRSVRGETLPIIAVTAGVFEDERQKVLAIGADNFISKPVYANELFEKMRLLLDTTYVYAEEQAEGEDTIDRAGLREMVSNLPEDLGAAMTHAMTILDLDHLKELLPRVADHNAILADKLNSMAVGCRIIELTELFPNDSQESFAAPDKMAAFADASTV